MKEKIPLSVAIITKNEESNLPRCLESVSFAEQLIVLDSGSTDRTLEIAAAHGCEIHIEPWKGFGAQKQSAIDKCSNEWILLLDADERVPEETRTMIANVILKGSSARGCSFPRKNYFQGRWIRHMGWWPDRITRLFKKKYGRMEGRQVHESVIVEGEVLALNSPIEHFTESRLERILAKIDHYSTLGALEAFREGKKASIYSAFFRAAITFVQDYFLRLGFLDGPQGLLLSVTDAVNKFFKYAKLSLLQKPR